MQWRYLSFVCFAALLTATSATSAAIKAIEEASEAAVRAAAAARASSVDQPQNSGPSAGAELVRLEAALKRGEQVNTSLRNEVQALERERAQLVQVQAVLTSGLVGALVTAVVAVAGAVVTSRNSKPDRDLKRLTVVEKLRELDASGAAIPEDIRRTYAPANAPEA